MSNLERWHEVVAKGDLKLLESLLAKDVTFHSPILFKPKEGKKLTTIFLSAAFKVLMPGGFKYIKTLDSPEYTMLEFECELDGIKIDGVDIITWNEQGEIVEFKVMIRPFTAIEKVGELMRKELESMSLIDKARLKFA
ncbi:MAG: nuclear transport factor 2 family protein [Flavobacteriales bacterium]|nr:nuclear transport factor 2 family protein [Flavobacteriales bacterium]